MHRNAEVRGLARETNLIQLNGWLACNLYCSRVQLLKWSTLQELKEYCHC